VRTHHLASTNPDDLSEGINVLHHNVGNDTYILAEKAGMTTRCWSCHKNKDGSIDCIRITCPWDPPPAPTKAQ
jgi:hypothetical protein